MQRILSFWFFKTLSSLFLLVFTQSVLAQSMEDLIVAWEQVRSSVAQKDPKLEWLMVHHPKAVLCPKEEYVAVLFKKPVREKLHRVEQEQEQEQECSKIETHLNALAPVDQMDMSVAITFNESVFLEAQDRTYVLRAQKTLDPALASSKAFVFFHEIAHKVCDHALKDLRSYKNKALIKNGTWEVYARSWDADVAWHFSNTQAVLKQEQESDRIGLLFYMVSTLGASILDRIAHLEQDPNVFILGQSQQGGALKARAGALRSYVQELKGYKKEEDFWRAFSEQLQSCAAWDPSGENSNVKSGAKSALQWGTSLEP